MQRFVADVQGKLPAGAVVVDALQRAALGRDASFYRLVPKAVVKAHSEADVAQVLRTAEQHGVPVTFRAAGTSLSGQGVTDSVLLRLALGSGSWVDMELLDKSGSAVRMGPGVIGAQANRLLLPLGRRLGPDPASVDSAMIGGIVANNASGMCCGVAQNSYHTMTDVRVVFAGGLVLDTADGGSVEQFRNSPFGAQLLGGLAELRQELLQNEVLAARVRKKFEIKCTTGYSLNAFTDYEEPLEIMKHLLVGSEGTLAFLSSVTMETVTEHRHKASNLLLFSRIHHACEAATILKEAGVADAAELMDAASLAATKKKLGGGAQALPPGLDRLLARAGQDSAALLVEARAASAEELAAKVERVRAALARADVEVDAGFSTDALVCSSYWGVRKGLLPIVGSSRPPGSTLLLEDVAAPTDQLANMTEDVQRLFAELGFAESVLFGHALDGNLHLLFCEDFAGGEDTRRYAALMDRLCALVVSKYDGSCKAEHGTGRNVAPFVELEWGSEAWELMWRVKRLFDPSGVLNPGVVLNRDSSVHLKDIKHVPLASSLIDECIECGFCESVCPSRDLTLTPRQRIAAFREVQAAQQRLPGCLSGTISELQESYQYSGLDTCAGDSMCATKCPVGIDTGALVKSLRADGLSPLQRKVGEHCAEHFGAVMAGARVAMMAAAAGHTLLGNTAMAAAVSLANKAGAGFGLTLPPWTSALPKPNSSFPKQLRQASAVAEAEFAYLPSCSTRCFGAATESASPSTTQAMLSLFGKAGARATMPAAADRLCCGLAWESRGMGETADVMAGRFLKEAAALAKNGAKVVVDNSPCLERLRTHAKLERPDVQLLGVLDTAELLKDRLSWRPSFDALEVHVPCSAKIARGDAEMASLEMLLRKRVLNEGATLSGSGISCCGMAGDRGMRFPELVKAARAGRPPEFEDLAGQSPTRVSMSRTCEIAMDAASLPVLLDQCASPLK